MSVLDDGDNAMEAREALDAAINLHDLGDLAGALSGYEKVLALDHRVTEVRPVFAGLLEQTGALEEALDQWDQVIALEPFQASAHHGRGLVLRGLGRLDEAIEAIRQACAFDPSNPVLANNLAVILSDAGRKQEALRTFRQASALQPDNIHIRHQIRRLGSEAVPFWHIPMMNDARRNDAFEAAIKAAIAQAGTDARILDVGAGSGLLSLMAARAGSKKVVACEMVPVIADMAKRIVAANGFADQIEILEKASTELEIGVDLQARADILVSEILSSDLLTEKVLDTFEDAHARLLKPDAIVIPRVAVAMGCLVASDVLAEYAFVNEVSGFDLSDFTAFAAQRLPIHGTMTAWQHLSNDFELVRLDLRSRRHDAALHRLSVPVTANGVAVGIVQWMHVELADGVFFDNHPDGYTDGGWLQVLHSFPEPIDVTAGQMLDLAVGHDRATLIVMPLELPSGRQDIPE